MQTVAETLQAALELERRGRQLYLEVADRVVDPVIKAVLVALANDEQAHENVISRYYHALEKHQAWPAVDSGLKPGTSIKRIKQILEGTAGKIGTDATFLSVYESARDLELRSRDFYRSQANAADDRQVVELFRFLASLEQAHLEALELVVEATRKAAETEPRV